MRIVDRIKTGIQRFLGTPARRQIRLLHAYFGISIVGLVGGTYFLVTCIYLAFFGSGSFMGNWWQPVIFIWVSTCTIGLITAGAHCKLMELDQLGGKGMAFMLNGRQTGLWSDSEQEKQLIYLVKEVADACQVPIPAVYILDSEQGINSFAAGNCPEDAVLGLTKGCLHYLTKKELKTIIAHEFFHILNGDMRVNSHMLGLLNGMVWISNIGRFLAFEYRWQRPWFLFSPTVTESLGFGLIGLGFGGRCFSRWIKSRLSKKREFMADAFAVELTNDAAGLCGVMKKIGGLGPEGSFLNAFHAEDGSQFYFSQGVYEGRFKSMHPHPPIVDRIIVLDADFKGDFPEVRDLTLVQEVPEVVSLHDSQRAFALNSMFGGKAVQINLKQFPDCVILSDCIQLNTVNDNELQLNCHDRLAQRIPASLSVQADKEQHASLILYLLLTAEKDPLNTIQLKQIRKWSHDIPGKAIDLMNEEVRKLPALLKLPLADQCLATLRQSEHYRFVEPGQRCLELIEGYDTLPLFPFTLKRIIDREQENRLEKIEKKPEIYRKKFSYSTLPSFFQL